MLLVFAFLLFVYSVDPQFGFDDKSFFCDNFEYSSEGNIGCTKNPELFKIFTGVKEHFCSGSQECERPTSNRYPFNTHCAEYRKDEVSIENGEVVLKIKNNEAHSYVGSETYQDYYRCSSIDSLKLSDYGEYTIVVRLNNDPGVSTVTMVSGKNDLGNDAQFHYYTRRTIQSVNTSDPTGYNSFEGGFTELLALSGSHSMKGSRFSIDPNEYLTIKIKVLPSSAVLSFYREGESEPVSEKIFTDDDSSKFNWFIKDTTNGVNELNMYLNFATILTKQVGDDYSNTVNIDQVGMRIKSVRFQTLLECDPGCVNGKCTLDNQCVCDEGYGGDRCERKAICQGISRDDNSVCLGRGVCVSDDICTCNTGEEFEYKGNNCEIRYKPDVYCSPYWGNDDNSCSGNGGCIAHYTCECLDRYQGNNCETPVTCREIKFNEENVCSGHGYCNETAADNPIGSCVCESGYEGDDCEIESIQPFDPLNSLLTFFESDFFLPVVIAASAGALVVICIIIVVISTFITFCCCKCAKKSGNDFDNEFELQ